MKLRIATSTVGRNLVRKTDRASNVLVSIVLQQKERKKRNETLNVLLVHNEMLQPHCSSSFFLLTLLELIPPLSFSP